MEENVPGKDVKGLDQLDREAHNRNISYNSDRGAENAMLLELRYLEFPLISNRELMKLCFVCNTCAA